MEGGEIRMYDCVDFLVAGDSIHVAKTGPVFY
jgi:hypothetical protein